jgi:hypothetical protein
MGANTTDKMGLAAENGQAPEDTTDPRIVAAREARHKAFVNTQVRAALLGWEVRRVCPCGFLLSRWGRSVECASLDMVNERLDRMQGARHVG